MNSSPARPARGRRQSQAGLDAAYGVTFGRPVARKPTAQFGIPSKSRITPTMLTKGVVVASVGGDWLLMRIDAANVEALRPMVVPTTDLKVAPTSEPFCNV